MRFFVEVTPIGKSDTQKYCVDADSWQKALQNVRSLRKEDGSISGFSIELADDGYRAVDPTARLRYMVKKAPADALLSNGYDEGSASVPSAKSQAPPTVAVVASPAPVQVAVQPVVAPAPMSAPAAAPGRPLSRTMSFGSSGTALLAQTQNQPPAPPPSVPRVSPSKPAPPRAAAVAPPTAPAHVAPLVGAEKSDSVPPSSKRPAGPIVVLYKKEQEPTAASPISYREEVFAAPPSTTEEQAEAILRAQFQIVSEALALAPSGKYVNLAVFDRVFEGRPPVPPLVTLTWKDWKGGGPTLTFPRRAKAQLSTSTQPSNLSTHAASATSQPVPAAPDPVASPAAVFPSQPASVARAPSNRPAPASTDARAVAASAPPARARVEMNESTVVVKDDSSDALPTMEVLPNAASSVEILVEPSAPAPIAVALTPAPVPVVPPAPSSANLVAPGSSSARRASWKQTPAALDGSRVRVRGDELIALLFEEMHDLNFMADALEGAAFCLWVALDKLPSSAGFIHFYDIDKREYVIASVAGVAGVEQATKRISQNDPWLAEAMRRRTAFVVADASSHEGANVERFAAFGGARSVIVAPLMLGGRALGAIEIVNPIDGAPFGEDDANAIAYMAEQFAEFVSSHGMVVDETRIRRASLAPAAH